MNLTEQRYTEAARLVAGVSAIGHLLIGATAESRLAYEALLDAATANEALRRDRNLSENGWAYNEPPSALIHPDHTDPEKRRPVVVGIVCPDEADLDIETAGPFPMEVADPADDQKSVIVISEAGLLRNFHERYGEAVTTIRPMPLAARPEDGEDQDRYQTRSDA